MPTATKPPDLRPHILAAVRQFWGFDTLRPMQEEAILAGIGKRDSLVVMPTGGGKSLCYQVPPLLTGKLGIVVSPLIALMKDQVDGLRLAGYAAAALHSNLTAQETRQVERDLAAGKLRLLFAAPERLLTPWFIDRLRTLGADSFAIDEAHCISQWGHDFRPEYRRLAELREAFPAASVHAYTATATPRVRRDIIAQLRLRDPLELVGVFDRPNLIYRIVPRLDRDDQILQVLARHNDSAVIIYCLSRKETEAVAEMINGRLKPGAAAAYHAGMDAAERRRVQEEFARERLNIVVATVAFGMGIDRSNVRCVLHATLPKSIEAYQQETGRAGRDGLDAECVLLYSAADAVMWERLMEKSAAESESDSAFEALEAQIHLLRQMQRFAAGMACRHRALSEYFGQAYTPPAPLAGAGAGCRACDVCLQEMDRVADAQVIAQKILSCIYRVGQRFGAAHVIDVLRGSRSAKVLDLKHDQLSTHGILKHLSKPTLNSFINQLIDQGVIERSEGEFPVLRLNEASRAVFDNTRAVFLLSPRLPAETPRTAPEAPPADPGLVQSLRGLRRIIADELRLPPYLVFGDDTLEELARARPGSLGALASIRGIGEIKLRELGDRLLAHLRDYCRKHGLPLDAGAGSRPRKAPGKTSSAYDSLYSMGRSVEEVAAKMQVTTATAAEHLAAYVLAHKPERIDTWIDDRDYAEIEAAAEELRTRRLKPIFDHLDGRISYARIRVVMNHLQTLGKV